MSASERRPGPGWSIRSQSVSRWRGRELSWGLAGRRPRRFELAVGSAAALGVALVVIRPGAAVDAVGVLAAVAANLSFATGVVLTKRFPTPGNRLAATGWQLLIGGAVLLPLRRAPHHR